MKTAGRGICLLAVTLSGIVCMGIVEQRNPVRELVVMVALAACTFTFLISAVILTAKAHRSSEDALVIRRDVSLVSSLGSMLSLERGMLGSVGNASGHFALVMQAVS